MGIYKNKMKGARSFTKKLYIATKVKQKNKMKGAGSFSKKMYLRTRMKPKNKQTIKTVAKWGLGLGLVPIPFVLYQGIKHGIYLPLTKNRQQKLKLKKGMRAVEAYNTKLTKVRGSSGTYAQQLQQTKKVLENPHSTKTQRKAAELTRRYINAKLSRRIYQAEKFIQRYMNKHNLQQGLENSARSFKKGVHSKYAYTTNEALTAPDKIRQFIQDQKKQTQFGSTSYV